jgi:hypothetical protein
MFVLNSSRPTSCSVSLSTRNTRSNAARSMIPSISPGDAQSSRRCASTAPSLVSSTSTPPCRLTTFAERRCWPLTNAGTAPAADDRRRSHSATAPQSTSRRLSRREARTTATTERRRRPRVRTGLRHPGDRPPGRRWWPRARCRAERRLRRARSGSTSTRRLRPAPAGAPAPMVPAAAPRLAGYNAAGVKGTWPVCGPKSVRNSLSGTRRTSRLMLIESRGRS